MDPALKSALQAVRKLGYKTGLHTGGAYPRRLASILPLLDWVGFDVKAPPSGYDAITQRPGSDYAAWESLRLLLSSRRTPHRRLTG